VKALSESDGRADDGWGAGPDGLSLDLSIGFADGHRDENRAGWLPDASFLSRHAALALPPHETGGVRYELSVRLVANEEGARLNRDYRGVDRPTNVLSFESGLPPLDGWCALGDLVFCPAVIACEAREQDKGLSDHWAHLVVHGTLHLLGHDHQDDAAADAMEALEIRLLSRVGIADPYRGTADDPDE